MSGHTPGPWFVSSTDETVIRTADGGIVAFSTSGEYGEACLPNAILIAAAPDLLAALKAALIALEHEDNRSYEDDASLDLARAAIAKAEGTK